MFSQRLLPSVTCKNLEDSWRSFAVRVGKHRIINFGRAGTENAAVLRSLAGESGFIVIRINGREVIRKLNPERRGSYQFMMPAYVSGLKQGERIIVQARPVSRREFVEKAVESLPFGLKLKLESEDEGVLSIMDALSFPVRVARFEWSEGNNALEVDLEFWGDMEYHILAIAVKGEEKKATIRFRKTSGTIHSIRLGTIPRQIIVRYHDFKGKYFDHSINLHIAPLKQVAKQANKLELNNEEIDEIGELAKTNQTLFGNKIRDKVVDAILKAGEVAGIKINPDKYKTEVLIGKRNEKIDAVFESDCGKLIVLEVKSTVDPENVEEQHERAWKRLRGDMRKGKLGYIQLIKEYGLEFGNRIRKDVDAYIIALVKIDLGKRACNVEMREVPKG
jgi:hypothetical protein